MFRSPHVKLGAVNGVGVERILYFVFTAFVVYGRTRVQNAFFFFLWLRYRGANRFVLHVTPHHASHYTNSTINGTLKRGTETWYKLAKHVLY